MGRQRKGVMKTQTLALLSPKTLTDTQTHKRSKQLLDS